MPRRSSAPAHAAALRPAPTRRPSGSPGPAQLARRPEGEGASAVAGAEDELELEARLRVVERVAEELLELRDPVAHGLLVDEQLLAAIGVRCPWCRNQDRSVSVRRSPDRGPEPVERGEPARGRGPPWRGGSACTTSSARCSSTQTGGSSPPDRSGPGLMPCAPAETARWSDSPACCHGRAGPTMARRPRSARFELRGSGQRLREREDDDHVGPPLGDEGVRPQSRAEPSTCGNGTIATTDDLRQGPPEGRGGAGTPAVRRSPRRIISSSSPRSRCCSPARSDCS